METDSSGLECLLFHLIADGKVGRKMLEIAEYLESAKDWVGIPYAIRRALGDYVSILGKV